MNRNERRHADPEPHPRRHPRRRFQWRWSRWARPSRPWHHSRYRARSNSALRPRIAQFAAEQQTWRAPSDLTTGTAGVSSDAAVTCVDGLGAHSDRDEFGTRNAWSGVRLPQAAPPFSLVSSLSELPGGCLLPEDYPGADSPPGRARSRQTCAHHSCSHPRRRAAGSSSYRLQNGASRRYASPGRCTCADWCGTPRKMARWSAAGRSMFDSQVADLDAVGAAGADPVVVARVHPVPVPDFASRRVGGPQVSPGPPCTAPYSGWSS